VDRVSGLWEGQEVPEKSPIHEHKRCGAYLRHIATTNPELPDDVIHWLATKLEDGAALLPFPGFNEATGEWENAGPPAL
jgi:hypothetical protein